MEASMQADAIVINRERRSELINELRDIQNWYEFWSNTYGLIWNGMTFAVVALTALTSVLIAAGFGQAGRGKIVLIALPAIASLLTTLLVQFKIKESWQLRETGSLESARLVLEAKQLSENDADIRGAAYNLRLKAHQIGERQAALFFEELLRRVEDPAVDGGPKGGSAPIPGKTGEAKAQSPAVQQAVAK